MDFGWSPWRLHEDFDGIIRTFELIIEGGLVGAKKPKTEPPGLSFGRQHNECSKFKPLNCIAKMYNIGVD